jgi:hypothetical protein
MLSSLGQRFHASAKPTPKNASVAHAKCESAARPDLRIIEYPWPVGFPSGADKGRGGIHLNRSTRTGGDSVPGRSWTCSAPSAGRRPYGPRHGQRRLYEARKAEQLSSRWQARLSQGSANVPSSPLAFCWRTDVQLRHRVYRADHEPVATYMIETFFAKSCRSSTLIMRCPCR